MDYNVENRGKIQFRERSRQVIDFSGMRFKNITPTDIDGMIDYKGKGFVFYEYKLRDAVMSRGQRLALERVADSIQRKGKKACVLYCSHETDNPEEDIDAANARVVSTYFNGKWKDTSKDSYITARQATDKFIQMIEKGK